MIRHIALLGLLCVWTPAFGSSPWDEFLTKPGMQNLAVLRASIAPGIPGDCSHTVMPTAPELARLQLAVATGDVWAARAALVIAHCLGVGDFEDINRSFGRFLEVRPSELLELTREAATQDEDLKLMVTMLPLGLVDQLDAQIAALENRVKIVRLIDRPDLQVQKGKVLTFLEHHRQYLVDVRSEIGDKDKHQK